MISAPCPGSVSSCNFVRLLIEDRKRLALDNLALRHELGVLKRTVSTTEGAETYAL